MDTEKIRALIKCVELGSITSAAQNLNYTTSGISKMVSSLEDDFGIKLLIRDKKGVKPTSECETLIGIMKNIEYWDEQLLQSVYSIKGLDIGEVRIGTSYVVYYKVISDIISKFSKKYPHIRIIISDGSSSELVKSIEEKDLDVAIVSWREGNYKWRKIVSDEMMIMLPKEHYLSQKNAYPIKMLSEESFIEFYPGRETDYSRVFKKLGIKPNVRFSTNDSFSACKVVEAGLGISMVNKAEAISLNADVSYLPLDSPVIVDIGIACQNDSIISPAAKRFVDFMEENILDIEKAYTGDWLAEEHNSL